MDTTSLDNFKREINQIREYLKHIKYVNDISNYTILELDNEKIKLLLNTLKKHYEDFSTDKKVFEYKSVIISLYGILERYVETWIMEYLNLLSIVVNDYNQVDKKIRDNHFDLSLKLINIISSRESAKYQHLTKEQVLEKLNNCITNPLNYKFNKESFVLSSGNLKHKKVVELFNLININLNEELPKNSTLISHFQDEHQVHDIKKMKSETLFNKIDNLVDRRNEIAHGSDTLNILNISELEPYIIFLEKYCQAIFEILIEKCIMIESLNSFQRIDIIHNVWHKSILGFEIENYQIKLGEFLIIKTSDNHYCKKAILELKINNQSFEELQISTKTNIAIRIEPSINMNCTFYLLRKEE